MRLTRGTVAQMSERCDGRLPKDITPADDLSDQSDQNVADMIRFLHEYSVEKLRSICIDGN